MKRSRISASVALRASVLAVVMTVGVFGCTASDPSPPSGPSGDVQVPTSVPTLGGGRDAPWTPSWSPTPSHPSESPSPGGRSNAVVTRVVDGDTVYVRYRGRTVDVRLIGIDTPETVDPSQPVGCYGKAASHFTTARLTGERVRLTFDVEHKDQYERTLAYMWIGGRLFNEVLVRQGFASVSTYPPNVKYVDRFLAAQRVAQKQERGLWGKCASGGGGGRKCDPSYPDVCIPPPPPDLDCGDIRFHSFRVRGADPHNFDGDHNGIGCESG